MKGLIRNSSILKTFTFDMKITEFTPRCTHFDCFAPSYGSQRSGIVFGNIMCHLPKTSVVKAPSRKNTVRIVLSDAR